MEIIIPIIQMIAGIAGFLVALMSITLFLRLRWPAPALWFLKLCVSALSPLLLLIGILSTCVGLITSSVFISLIGMYVFVTFVIHIFRITRPPDVSSNFELAFGLQWEVRINPEQGNHFLQSRRILMLPMVVKPRMEQNISIATIPETNRKLLYDI